MQKTRSPRLGEVWDVEFDPVTGHEQGGRRSALVISNDRFNHTLNGFCIVVPITSKNRGIRLHIPIGPPEGGLTLPSVILPDQAKSVSQLRARKFRGEVTEQTLRRVQAVVGKFIDRE